MVPWAFKKRLMLQRFLEAAIGFEPMHGGFADLSLNHLGTPPLLEAVAITTEPDQLSCAGKCIN